MPLERLDQGDGELPSHSPDGVDLTLVRWMLALSPAERLQVLQSGARSLAALAGKAAGDGRGR